MPQSVTGSARLHSEWFDFASQNPRDAVRAALLALDELAWLRGMRAAVEEAASEQGGAQLARARKMLQDALAVEAKILAAEAEAEQQRAAIRARQKEIAAGIDYDALCEQAAAAVWAALPRPGAAS